MTEENKELNILMDVLKGATEDIEKNPRLHRLESKVAGLETVAIPALLDWFGELNARVEKLEEQSNVSPQ
jgi:hypothetical protein